MAIKQRKPTTAANRFTALQDFSELTPGKRPERALLATRKSNAGRNSAGRITIRHRGGGHKRHLRVVDFVRHDKAGMPARVIAIEYDPNRTARLALLQYGDGVKRYILAPNGLLAGARVVAGPQVEPEVGNAMPLAAIPLGLPLHNVELRPGAGAVLVRSAGQVARIVAREGVYTHVKMPSGEVRMIHNDCYATIGQVGNLEHEKESLGKAGRKRWMGIRPTVRGVAMNPIDHPMGGGEGRTSGGGHPVSPWGKLAKGGKTRNPRNPSKNLIVERRK